MRITSRVEREIYVLDVEGKLAGAISGGSPLSEVVLDKLNGGLGLPRTVEHRVLLNLAACTGADSLGIGELISLHVSLANRGGTLKILHLPERIGELLRATQLISMFEIFDDEGAALAAFG